MVLIKLFLFKGKIDGSKLKADKLLRILRDSRTDDDIPVIMTALEISCNSRVLQIFKQHVAGIHKLRKLLISHALNRTLVRSITSSYTKLTHRRVHTTSRQIHSIYLHCGIHFN